MPMAKPTGTTATGTRVMGATRTRSFRLPHVVC